MGVFGSVRESALTGVTAMRFFRRFDIRKWTVLRIHLDVRTSCAETEPTDAEQPDCGTHQPISSIPVEIWGLGFIPLGQSQA